MKKLPSHLVLALFITMLCVSGGFAADINQIVAFGDSLSDDGNLQFFEGQPEPDPSVYWEGRFSNGPVWVEHLANPQRLNMTLDGRALGGAQSAGLLPPGLIEQVLLYLIDAGTPLSPNALFIIWIGGNDYLNGDGDFQAAVSNIEEAMRDLVDAGAMHLLVLNLPDLGLIPDIQDRSEQPLATQFSIDFNNALGEMLDVFSVAHPQVGLYVFDVDALYAEIRADPSSFGFTNVDEQSPNFTIPDNFDGAGHVFWDDIHPTTEMHEVLADRVLVRLNQQGVPPSDPARSDTGDSSLCFIGTLW